MAKKDEKLWDVPPKTSVTNPKGGVTFSVPEVVGDRRATMRQR